MSAMAASSAIFTGLCRGKRVTRPQANPRRALCGGGQHHEWIGQDREGAAEVELAEPYRIEAQGIPELDLREEVLVPLTLRIRVGARQLVEEAETHIPSSRLLQGQPDESVGPVLSVEVAAGRDDVFEDRRRDREPGDDAANAARLLVEVPDELAPGGLLRVALTVLRVDRDPRAEERH